LPEDTAATMSAATVAIFVVGAFTGAAEPAPWGFSGVSSQAEKTQAQTMAANAAR
jgi:hypothetical protein